MKIHLLEAHGLDSALLGLGLSYNLTTPYACWDDVPGDTKQRLYKIAEKLCSKDGGENKFLRQMMYVWSVEAPRYWWQEASTYKVATVEQSSSTMHTIMHGELVQENFETPIPIDHLYHLNRLIAKYKETKSEEMFLLLKNDLPEGFLQRRVWSLSLVNMKNIYAQRHRHRLPQWHLTCQAFVDATPGFLQGIYDDAD